MSAATKTRRIVADFVQAFTPSVDEMMTSMMAGPHDMPIGHVADQTYKKRKKKKRGDRNKSRRSGKDEGSGQAQSTADRARSLIADALKGEVDRPASAEGNAKDVTEAARRRQLPAIGRRLPVATRQVGFLESRIRSGLRLEFQGDDTQLGERNNHLHVRTQQEDW